MTQKISTLIKENRIYSSVQLIWRLFIFPYRAHHRRIRIALLRSIYHAYKLYFYDGFNPRDAQMLGFFSKYFVYGSHIKYISKRQMSVLQHQVNPSSWEPLTEDKSIFYQICIKSGLPTPKLFGVVFNSATGWSFLDQKPIMSGGWNDFVCNSLPPEFVIKPSNGAYGKEIKILNRSNGGFVDEKRCTVSPDQIYEIMTNNVQYSGFVIQERLVNHPALVELSGSEFLQTIRIVTYIDFNGHVKIYHASLKIIVGDNYIDNIDNGNTGNLAAEINIQNGTLDSAIYANAEKCFFKTVNQHPDTGIMFSGFAIPLWREACELAVSAAKHFVPLRTIGWDIAITPNGPFIIEGNFTYDPPGIFNIEPLLSEMRS